MLTTFVLQMRLRRQKLLFPVGELSPSVSISSSPIPEVPNLTKLLGVLKTKTSKTMKRY